MSATPTFEEDSEAVKALVQGKTRLRSMGLVSLYRLRNGWIARRQTPENRWSRRVYWTIFQNEEAVAKRRPLGGGEHRLARALANVLNNRTDIRER